jgi:hypothetical protein
MKHHDAFRPIGKCKGCCLNQKTRCAAGLEPKAQWSRRRCRSFDDQELLARLQYQSEPTGAKLARRRRQTAADQADTHPHYNGVLDPGKMAGRAKRRQG